MRTFFKGAIFTIKSVIGICNIWYVRNVSPLTKYDGPQSWASCTYENSCYLTLALKTLSETQKNVTFYLSKPELRKSPLVPGLCRVFYLSGLIAHFLNTTCFATLAQIITKMLEKDETESIWPHFFAPIIEFLILMLNPKFWWRKLLN